MLAMAAAALIYILAVASPGPNFLLVSRCASSRSVRAGLGAALGIVSVGLLFSTACVTGLSALIRAIPSFDRFAGAAAAAYLVLVAGCLIRAALDPTTASPTTSRGSGGFWRAWQIGALTNVGNVKTIAFMVSIVAGFLVVERSGAEKANLIAICSSLEFLWYAGVAGAFGRGFVQAIYARHSRLIDLGMAAIVLMPAGRAGSAGTEIPEPTRRSSTFAVLGAIGGMQHRCCVP